MLALYSYSDERSQETGKGKNGLWIGVYGLHTGYKKLRLGTKDGLGKLGLLFVDHRGKTRLDVPFHATGNPQTFYLIFTFLELLKNTLSGRDPFNQNSDRSNREKRSTSKGGPVFSKLFRLDRTDPLSFGPKFPEILVEWIAPLVP